MSQPARWITAVATALLLLLLSAPSQAAKPEREVVPFEGTRFPFFPCSEFGYDFDILVDFFGSDTVTTWRDSEGNITRIKVHDYGTGTIYPDTDPTNRETGSGPINITVDFLKETYTLSGQESHNNVPGEGRVAIKAARSRSQSRCSTARPETSKSSGTRFTSEGHTRASRTSLGARFSSEPLVEALLCLRANLGSSRLDAASEPPAPGTAAVGLESLE